MNFGKLQRKLAVPAIAGVALFMALARSAAGQSASENDFAPFQLIGQRNIFDPNRMPRIGARSAPKVVDSFAFVGTLSYVKGTFAFFNGTSSDFRKVIKLDGDIAGFKVTAITPKSVALLPETNAMSGTNEIVLQMGMQMRRGDDGQWMVSTESATYAGAGNFSGSQRSGMRNFRWGSTTDNLQPDDSNPQPPDGAPDTGTDMSAPEAPPPGGTNNALTRLMQRRAQEEQQLGQGQ